MCTATRPAPSSETTVRHSTVRQIARCKKCKTVRSRVIERETTTTTRWSSIGLRVYRATRDSFEGMALTGWDFQQSAAGTCKCTQWRGNAMAPAPMFFEDVIGTTNKTPCDDRCTGATGHKCQCSCGGKNHGADHG
jgi:hypothetical protein